jgi:hypothetical protein
MMQPLAPVRCAEAHESKLDYTERQTARGRLPDPRHEAGSSMAAWNSCSRRGIVSPTELHGVEVVAEVRTRRTPPVRVGRFHRAQHNGTAP